MQGTLSQKYPGSKLVGVSLIDAITKEEWVAIAFYLAQRVSAEGQEIKTIIEEFNTLCDNQIIAKKKLVEPCRYKSR